MSFIKKNIWIIPPVLVAFLLIFFNLLSYLDASKIGTDAVSWFLPAKSVIKGTGVPYKDFWDTKPSGLILVSSFWLLIFGESINAFKFLHLILISICAFGMMRIYYLIFPRVLFAVLYILSIIVFMSPRIQTQLLLIELFGLSFALIALNILITKKWSAYRKAYFASLFFTLGGQMKESYALLILSMLPFVVHTAIFRKPELKKTILYSVLGILSCLLVLFAFIILTSTFSSYIEVLQFIMRFNSPSKIDYAIEFPKSTFVYLQYSIVQFLLAILAVYLFSKYKLGEIGLVNKKKNKTANLNLFAKLSIKNSTKSIVLFYALGSWIGFMMQNRFGSHYDAQMVFPVMLLISLPIYILSESIKKNLPRLNNSQVTRRILSLIITLIIAIALFPKKDYFIEYPFRELNIEYISYLISKGQNPDMSIENAIMKKTNPSGCIVHVYGWGVGTTYFYSNRKPCSRFFLVNLLPDTFYQEYKTTLINSPPSAIVYTLGGADIDNIRFENQVFNFKNVINNCYVNDGEVKDLYFPKVKGTELKSCLEKNS